MGQIYFHDRLAVNETPAGLTVSRTETLPDGDFIIDEYAWPDATLWFVANHNFTADERQLAYEAVTNFVTARKS